MQTEQKYVILYCMEGGEGLKPREQKIGIEETKKLLAKMTELVPKSIKAHESTRTAAYIMNQTDLLIQAPENPSTSNQEHKSNYTSAKIETTLAYVPGQFHLRDFTVITIKGDGSEPNASSITNEKRFYDSKGKLMTDEDAAYYIEDAKKQMKSPEYAPTIDLNVKQKDFLSIEDFNYFFGLFNTIDAMKAVQAHN